MVPHSGVNPGSRVRINQSGDALCCVSPARCAGSFFTFAKRIARLIACACGSTRCVNSSDQ